MQNKLQQKAMHPPRRLPGPLGRLERRLDAHGLGGIGRSENGAVGSDVARSSDGLAQFGLDAGARLEVRGRREGGPAWHDDARVGVVIYLLGVPMPGLRLTNRGLAISCW